MRGILLYKNHHLKTTTYTRTIKPIPRIKMIKRALNTTITTTTNLIFKPGLIISGYFLLFYISHWGSVQIYTIYCQPSGFTGLMNSLITTGSPLCYALWKFADVILTNYVTLWSGITFITLLLLKNKRDSH
jgi:hypothetical protein